MNWYPNFVQTAIFQSKNDEKRPGGEGAPPGCTPKAGPRSHPCVFQKTRQRSTQHAPKAGPRSRPCIPRKPGCGIIRRIDTLLRFRTDTETGPENGPSAHPANGATVYSDSWFLQRSTHFIKSEKLRLRLFSRRGRNTNQFSAIHSSRIEQAVTPKQNERENAYS